MAIQPPLACAKSSPSLLPTDSILQDLPYLPDLPDLPELQDHSEQSENETNLDFDRKKKSYSQDISKRPVTLPSPAGDTKVDDESTLKIGQDDTYTVPSSETDDSHQMPEEDLREELLKVLEKRSDLHQNLKESLVKCSLSLASYSNCRENLSKCSLELARVINGSVNKSSAHQDPGQKSCRSIEENLSTKGLLSYSNIDANQKSCELNKLPLIQSQLRISRDKLEPEFEEEFEDLVCLKSALFEVAVALSVGKVWRGLEAEQKAAYDKAIRFGPSSFNANPSGHWQDIQKFTAAIFNIIQELRAVENSTKRVDFYSIFGKALSFKILSLEECKRMELLVLSSGTEKQPEFGGLHDDSDELLLLNKTEHASGHKLCIEPKFDLPPTPDTNKLQRSSDVIHPISNIEVDISRQKEVLQSILSSLNASEKVLQEPRKVGGPEMSAAVVQEVTKRDAFHAAITNFAGLSSIMATELKNLKSQVKTVQDMIIKRDQNEFDDQASNTDNKDKADVDAKSVNPVYEAIQHKELDTTDLNTDESTLDGISKPNDIPEKEIGLAALTKFNTNTLYTPWCLNLGGKFYKRTCSRPNLMHKRLLCYGLSTEIIADLVVKSVEHKDDPISLAPFRHGVQCTGFECKSPKVLINGQPYELFPSKCNRTKPIQPPFNMSKQKLVQPTKVSDAMGANQLPINKNERLWTSPHNWDSSDTISPQFSTRNHLNTKKIQTNYTSEEYLGFLSDETQLMMNEARQKALSVRGMVMETRGKKQAGVFSNNMISSEHTQAQEMSIHNWLMIADARIKKLSSRDLLVASSGQEKENKTAASFDGTTTEFLRAPENANENPLIYDSEDDRPMGHLFERRTSSRRNFRPKKYIQTRAEKIDKIAVQGLERWGYSKAITPSAGNSELSNVTYSTVTREDKYPDSHKKLHKFTDAEVNTAKQPIVQGSSVITVPTQADTKFPHDKIAVFARAHNEDKPISEDSPAIIAPAQEYSQIKQMVNESPESYDQTQGTGQKSPIKSSMRKPSGTSKARLPKGAHDCEPEDILEDNLLKKVEDTNSDTKVEDGWVMADDEAEEWEIL